MQFARVRLALILVVLIAAEPLVAQIETFGLSECCPTEIVVVAETGTGTDLAEIGGPTDAFPLRTIAIDPVSRDLYALRNSAGGICNLLRVSLDSGTVTVSPNLTVELTHLAYDATFGLIGRTTCCPTGLVELVFATGQAVPIVTPPSTVVIADYAPLILDGSGGALLLGLDLLSLSEVFVAMSLGGGASTIGGALDRQLTHFAIHPDSGELYGLTACCPHEFVSIDPATGTTTTITSAGSARFAYAPVVDPIDPIAGTFTALRTELGGQRRVEFDLVSGAVTEGPFLSPELLLAVNIGVPSITFVRGDANGDATTNLADAITLLGHLFVPGATPLTCLDAGDANDDGVLQISDAVALLGALFIPGTPSLPAPLVCGSDGTGEALGCASFGGCP